MQNSFKQIDELIDNLLVISKENVQLPKIEKDILMEKLRMLYVQLQAAEEVEPVVVEEEKKEYEVQKGIEDDVDLFFDTDHESYGAPLTPEALRIAVEVESDPELPLDEPKASEPERVPEAKATREASKPDKLIEPEPIQQDDEDDLLQFIPKPEPKPQPKPESKVEPKLTPQPEPKPETPKATPSVAAQQKPQVAQTGSLRSLNDLFNKQQEDRSLGTQFQHAKVGDLTKAISINDKFTYIKELFNNKGEEFSAAIQQLNQCANMDQAFDCLEGLKKKYYWDSTATAYLSLCDLLRRKYL
ncbi:MAG: hypothetical protein K5636_03435 [Bacteroidales bacterium]|nr:hypothetical protein [Bacteroidales bacterium]